MSTLLEKVESVLDRQKNAVVTEYFDFDEILVLNKDFYDMSGIKRDDVVKRGRRFRKVADGEYVVTRDNTHLFRLEEQMQLTHKRAKDKFIKYARNNIWRYFVTLTIDQKHYGNDDVVVRGYFRSFAKMLKNLYNNARYLFCMERQQNGTIHFHGLMADVPRSEFSVAYDPHTNLPIFHNGRQCYNFNLWDYGFTTAYIVGDNLESNRKIINYCTKYMDKDLAFDYNQRVFYRSDNLVLPSKHNIKVDDINLDECVWIKASDNYNVYHRYKIDVQDVLNPFVPLVDCRTKRDLLTMCNLGVGSLSVV